MKKYLDILLVSLFIFITEESYAFNRIFSLSKKDSTYNPLLDKNFYDDIDFDVIKPEHYIEAIQKASNELIKEYRIIANNKEEPTFQNTILSLDQSGSLLIKVQNLYEFMKTSNRTQILSLEQKIEEKIVSEEDWDLRNKLFRRVEAVYKNKEVLNETDQRLVEVIYNTFDPIRMSLNEDQQEELYRIDLQLERLQDSFTENLVMQDPKNEIFIPEENKDRLEGVSHDVIASFKNEAIQNNKKGYLLTYQNPSIVDILLYCKDRSLRQEVYNLLLNQGKQINAKMVIDTMNLRLKKANILGFKNYAEYTLKNNSMVKTPQNVIAFLNKIKEPALKKSKQKYEELLKFSQEKDPNFELKVWDIGYYYQQQHVDINKLLKPYLELSNVREGVFTVINKLYGISFRKKENASLYYKNNKNGIEPIEVFELKDKDGAYLGLLYLDYFSREGKSGGGYTSIIKDREIISKKSSSIVVAICTNFSSQPIDGKILLSSDDVVTLFHEMGHAINFFVMKPQYNKLSMLDIDIGEVSSQILEKWAFHKEVLPLYARHYKTGKKIPERLIKMINEKDDLSFNIMTMIFFSMLDLEWNMIEEELYPDGIFNEDYLKLEVEFEDNIWRKYGFMPEYPFYGRTYNLLHFIDMGYESRGYNYLWSRMLVEEAFEQFREKGIFNETVADSFRKNFLSVGGNKDPLESYQKFSGKKYLDIKPLLKEYQLID